MSKEVYSAGRKRINFADLVEQTRPGNNGSSSTSNNGMINTPTRNINELIEGTRRVDVQLPVAINNISGKRFVFDITRETYNIPLPLPFVIGCPVAVAGNYRSIFRFTDTTPPGGTVAVRYNVTTGAMEIVWTVGADTDIITIQKKGRTPMVDFMEMMKTDFFTTLGFKYFGPTTNFMLQFQEYELNWGFMSLTGQTEEDTDDVPSFLAEDNFVQYMLPVEISNVFNGRRYLLNGFPAAPAVPATPTKITLAFITTAHGSSSNFGG